ncbi:hypothetical protein IEO21_00207 [Rhodonia placenta]|uniref:Uncharacterized protein n=2 Tax=Rhodonia placenta TaxID=104341 RepID=A0A1X6NG44_9APHY|nr:hypothetical protein POSPLADRAFT_1038084 [Postia placenta MAD-698-R-SB12]KAF9822213.1 hypothetical protein IEO21_00207 [Postia placenta]OSX67607.1 hypothetical protein POSPLADRAFT_1038084 [Postia placenta MAD-698-R-SB12]
MIAGFSRAITTLLAPLLALTAFLLILFSYLSPTLMLSTQVALLVVSPSTALTNSSSASVDGPNVFLGALGSCSRPNKEASVTCTVPTVSPTYNLSVLPSNAPDLLTAPTSTTPAFIAVSLAFTVIFLFMYTFTAHRGTLGRIGAHFERPGVQRATAWIGLLGFLIGITSFLVLFMWFWKAVDDFNDDISKIGSDAPELIASLSNGFVMVWVAYAFYAVPLVSSLAKLHVAGGKA